MKFPRNARIFRGRLDAAPFAAVLFLLVIFLMLASLVYTPGVRLELPIANDLPGTDQPSVSVAIDADGRLYFENQVIAEGQLTTRLRKAVSTAPRPLTLVVQADKATSMEMLVRVTELAREAGITNGLLATRPRPTATLQAPVPP
jgi:biopolymer transport protein ExbD